MQGHEERKDFVQNTTRRVEIFLKTRRACPCAVGDVLTLQSKNVFHIFVNVSPHILIANQIHVTLWILQ